MHRQKPTYHASQGGTGTGISLPRMKTTLRRGSGVGRDFSSRPLECFPERISSSDRLSPSFSPVQATIPNPVFFLVGTKRLETGELPVAPPHPVSSFLPSSVGAFDDCSPSCHHPAMRDPDGRRYRQSPVSGCCCPSYCRFTSSPLRRLEHATRWKEVGHPSY